MKRETHFERALREERECTERLRASLATLQRHAHPPMCTHLRRAGVAAVWVDLRSPAAAPRGGWLCADCAGS